MVPLLIFSIVNWYLIIERASHFRRVSKQLQVFHTEVVHQLLREDRSSLNRLCATHASLPTAQLLLVALDRLEARDGRLRNSWQEALERKRIEVGQSLKKNLWVLGTIGSAAPFVGLFGTVVGILQSFGAIAKTGQGGFTTVAGGISEALISTAGGIVVAVIAVLSFNWFQNRWSELVLLIKSHSQEMVELLQDSHGPTD